MKPIDRREFIKHSTLGLAATSIAAHIPADAAPKSVMDRLGTPYDELPTVFLARCQQDEEQSRI